jgi:hypothetical protein
VNYKYIVIYKLDRRFFDKGDLMKLIIGMIAVLVTNQALACAPARWDWIKQLPELQMLLESPALREKLKETGSNRVTAIEDTADGYVIRTGTPCSILATPRYVQPRQMTPGACSRLQDLELTVNCEPRD